MKRETGLALMLIRRNVFRRARPRASSGAIENAHGRRGTRAINKSADSLSRPSSAERQLLLHLMVNTQLVYRIPEEITLSEIGGEFVARLCLAPTIASEIGVLELIGATMAVVSGENSPLLEYVHGLAMASVAERKGLLPFHVVLANLQREGRERVSKATATQRPYRPKHLGALKQWRRELRRGAQGQRILSPSTWVYDELWRAACWEASAMDFERTGLYSAAVAAMQQAAAELAEKRSAS